jgi:hypothetical protein
MVSDNVIRTLKPSLHIPRIDPDLTEYERRLIYAISGHQPLSTNYHSVGGGIVRVTAQPTRTVGR